MAAVAEAAGVAVGTTYVHYSSKDELLFAAYLEVKREMGLVGVSAVDPEASGPARFGQLWAAVYRYFVEEPDSARFLVQFESSPYAAEGHRRAMAVADDPLLAEAARPDVAPLLADLPMLVLYDLALGPAARAVAHDVRLDAAAVRATAAACWRAITAG
jgi:TetR/AcrR family transcriptional repressor of multidrug resistance operon